MTSQEKAINLRYLFLTYKPGEKKKPINTFTSFFCLYWYVSIFSEKYFWPQNMYHKTSPNNGFRWCPLGKLSHLGLEQLSGEVYSWTKIRVLPGGYIIFQSQIILLNYRNIFNLFLLKRYDGSFYHIVIRCRLEDNFPWWFTTNLCSEDNHMIISTDVLYLNRFDCTEWYLVDFFRPGSRIYFFGEITYLVILG